MTTTASESVVLRAEAAVFNPSCNFAIASNTATGENCHHQQQSQSRNNKRNKNKKKGNGNQRKKWSENHQYQQDDDDDGRTKTDNRSNHNEINHQRQRRPRQQRPAQKKQNHCDRSKAKEKPPSAQHNSNKNKKTRRRRSRSRSRLHHGDKVVNNNTNKSNDCIVANNTNKTNDCIVANSNHVVDYWNYDIYGNELEGIPPSSESRTVSPVLNSSSLWYEVSVRDIPREEEKQTNTTSASNKSSTTKEETWCNGLQLLSSRREVIISSNSDKKYHDRTSNEVAMEEKQLGNEDNDGHEEKKHLYSCGGTTESVAGMMTTIPNKRIDISRLRDRWWTAVADQRIQREFRKELEEKLAFVRILVEKNDVDNCVIELGKEPISNIEDSKYDNNNNNNSGHGEIIYDKSISDRINTCSSSSENEDVYLSALDHHVKNNASTLPTTKLLECIVEQNDDRALRELLELSWIKNEKKVLHDHLCIATDRISSSNVIDKENGPDLVEHAIEVAIRQDMPQVLRTILSVTSGRVPIDTASKRYSSPLIQTVELGHEECASILLSTQDRGSTLLFLKDIDGNTALHYCCREKGDKSMLLMLLKQAIGNTKGKRQQFSKLVTARNKNMQTPLHVACQCGRNDLVEVFLTTCKSSLLFKVFSTTDIDNRTPLLTAVANNSCDVVVSLIMWRGNHSLHGPFVNNDESRCSQTKKALLTCPLVCAAHSGNLDMIELIIQFENHSGTVVYHVTEALLMLLRSDAPLHNKVKGSDILMHAGGNPFEEIDLSSVSGETETTIDVAARVGPDVILRSVISAGKRVIRNRQLSRRKDPKLQQQPDAFFRTLESKEDSEASSAMKNALIGTLFRAYTKQKALDFSAAIVLYEEMPKVDERDLTRLQTSMLHEKFTSYKPETKNYCFLATFEHYFCANPVDKGSKSSFLDYHRSVLAEKSFRLLNMPWVQSELIEGECFCPWVRGNAKKIKNQPTNLLLEDEVILVANGARLLVHASVVSEKSAKLASAIRFARMNRDEESCDKILHLAVSIPAHFLSLLIQHIYHGSICYGWRNMKDDNMCRYLLELMLIAEEFLIPSLVQEIEMRLLSSLPKRCFCWHCCQAVRVVSSEINKNVAQCLYCVDGNSRLVTSSSVMDILGLTEYMEGLEYGICLAPTSLNSINCSEPKKLWKSFDNRISKHENEIDSWQLNKAVVSLKDTTIIAILKFFASVVKYPDFYLDTEDVLNKEQLLLQMCLNELRNNSIVAASYSKSMRKLLKCNTDSFDDLTVDL